MRWSERMRGGAALSRSIGAAQARRVQRDRLRTQECPQPVAWLAERAARASRHTRPRESRWGFLHDEISEHLLTEHGKMRFTSRRAAANGRGSTPIRKKVIGRRMRVQPREFVRTNRFRFARRALALFHQPAREHGTRIFLKPLVEQRANLLTEIGGVTEAREFVTLQGIPRRREKKFPRRLCLGTGHVGLLGKAGASKVTVQ